MAAIAAASASSVMSESLFRVETMSRLAQWRIETLSSFSYRKSDPFKIGLWNWHLTVERNKQLLVRLYPEPSSVTKEHPPIASFIIKLVSCSAPNLKTVVHPGVCDKQLKNSDDFVWAMDIFFTGKFMIDVEFLDLKIVPQLGGEASSIWSGFHIEKNSLSTSLNSLGRMLAEGIHTDITVNTSNGSIAAHRAVLATRSPVFQSMFSHSLKEKELSELNISDVSFEACQVLINYIYCNNFNVDMFLAHRLALVIASDKYDIADLKEVCHESLLEDIDAKNVLERLHIAHLYSLRNLKIGCLKYLVNFGKIYEIRDELNEFLQVADRELVIEIFQEILTACKCFQ